MHQFSCDQSFNCYRTDDVPPATRSLAAPLPHPALLPYKIGKAQKASSDLWVENVEPGLRHPHKLSDLPTDPRLLRPLVQRLIHPPDGRNLLHVGRDAGTCLDRPRVLLAKSIVVQTRPEAEHGRHDAAIC